MFFYVANNKIASIKPKNKVYYLFLSKTTLQNSKSSKIQQLYNISVIKHNITTKTMMLQQLIYNESNKYAMENSTKNIENMIYFKAKQHLKI